MSGGFEHVLYEWWVWECYVCGECDVCAECVL